MFGIVVLQKKRLTYPVQNICQHERLPWLIGLGNTHFLGLKIRTHFQYQATRSRNETAFGQFDL